MRVHGELRLCLTGLAALDGRRVWSLGYSCRAGQSVHLGQFLQGLVAAMMKSPSPDCLADGRQRLRAGGRLEAVREDSLFPLPPHRLPRSKCKAEEVK